MEKSESEVQGQVTLLLGQLGAGDHAAADPLLSLIYGELRGLAARHMAGEKAGHTLGATALAHEAYLKLVAQDRVDWKSRAHFMGIAALAMRRILINHAKSKLADKRGAGAVVATFDEQVFGSEVQAHELVRLDEALTELATLSPRQSEVVTYRFFVGLGYEEIAEIMGISVPTVRRDWRFARASLLRTLGGNEPSHDDRGSEAR